MFLQTMSCCAKSHLLKNMKHHRLATLIPVDFLSIYPVLSYFVTCSLQVLFDYLNKRQMENLTLTRRLFCPSWSSVSSILWVCRYIYIPGNPIGTSPVTSGVPQGTDLIFVYINDLSSPYLLQVTLNQFPSSPEGSKWCTDSVQYRHIQSDLSKCNPAVEHYRTSRHLPVA